MSLSINFPAYGTITTSFSTVADLRAIPATQIVSNLHAILDGRLDPEDGGGGIWTWISDSVAADDGVDVVAIDGLATGRFVRVVKAIASSLTIGEIDTGPAGSEAEVSITGTAPFQTLNLTLPRGDVGDVTVEAEEAREAAEDARDAAITAAANVPAAHKASALTLGTTNHRAEPLRRRVRPRCSPIRRARWRKRRACNGVPI
jgi:hypothetical protein